MANLSNAIFDMVSKIVGAATHEENGYPVRLMERLKVRFAQLIGTAESLLGKIIPQE